MEPVRHDLWLGDSTVLHNFRALEPLERNSALEEFLTHTALVSISIQRRSLLPTARSNDYDNCSVLPIRSSPRIL